MNAKRGIVFIVSFFVCNSYAMHPYEITLPQHLLINAAGVENPSILDLLRSAEKLQVEILQYRNDYNKYLCAPHMVTEQIVKQAQLEFKAKQELLLRSIIEVQSDARLQTASFIEIKRFNQLINDHQFFNKVVLNNADMITNDSPVSSNATEKNQPTILQLLRAAEKMELEILQSRTDYDELFCTTQMVTNETIKKTSLTLKAHQARLLQIIGALKLDKRLPPLSPIEEQRLNQLIIDQNYFLNVEL